MNRNLTEFVARHFSAARESIRLRAGRLIGGLDSGGVLRVHADFKNRRGEARAADFVCKCLPAARTREIAAYRLLLPSGSQSFAPRLLGVQWDAGGARAYLEWIRARRGWPWQDVTLTGLAIERLALVHATLSPAWFRPPHVLAGWDHERELLASAAATVEVFHCARSREEFEGLRRSLPSLGRLTDALPRLRRQLGSSDLGLAVLHGDVHSGNVVARRRGPVIEPVLLDWGRTRLGSPLEDVSSWLQSLGFWEPEARRRHDTLLKQYLAARGFGTVLSRSLRDLYWIAAACNGLAGALRYHLLRLLDPAAGDLERSAAWRSAADWMRVMRRADAVCRT